MSRLSKEFRTDPKLENEGREFFYTSRSGEVLFRCRLGRMGTGNKRFIAAQEEVMAPYRRLKPTRERSEELQREIFAKSVIVPGTWETNTPEGFVSGIEMADGTVSPATWQNINTVLKEEEDLYLLLLQESLERENFRVAELEADSKNS